MKTSTILDNGNFAVEFSKNGNWNVAEYTPCGTLVSVEADCELDSDCEPCELPFTWVEPTEYRLSVECWPENAPDDENDPLWDFNAELLRGHEVVASWGAVEVPWDSIPRPATWSADSLPDWLRDKL